MVVQRPGFASSWQGTLTEILRFGFVGLLNTATTLILIWLLMASGTGPYLANLFGYGIGMAISFTLNRIWTFGQRKPAKWIQIVQFLLACSVSYLLNLGTVTAMLRAGVPPYSAQLVGVPVYTACFFLLSKHFVFTPRRRIRPSSEAT